MSYLAIVTYWAIIGGVVVIILARNFPHWGDSWKSYVSCILGGPAVWLAAIYYFLFISQGDE